MESIIIYQTTYQLPVGEREYFDQIQSQIKQRQEMIKHQKRVIVKQKKFRKKLDLV